MISFAVHSYNEADALRRMILSSLPLKPWISEWVVLDHRSDDHTPQMLDELASILKGEGVPLVRLYEGRDLSASYTFADLRNAVIAACRNDIVAIQDADFLFGPGYAAFLERAFDGLTHDGSPYYAACYAVPVIWDHVRIGTNGRLEDHGRVWVHNRKPRVLHRRAMTYAQTGQNGRWERPRLLTTERSEKLNLSHSRLGLVRDTCLSLNVKPAERLRLRDTMTFFMRDAVQGKLTGGWLENYRKGTAPAQGPYPFMNVNLRGWSLFGGPLALPHAA